jgi:hypothetical protein
MRPILVAISSDPLGAATRIRDMKAACVTWATPSATKRSTEYLSEYRRGKHIPRCSRGNPHTEMKMRKMSQELKETSADRHAIAALAKPERELSCVELDQVTAAKGPTGGTLNV